MKAAKKPPAGRKPKAAKSRKKALVRPRGHADFPIDDVAALLDEACRAYRLPLVTEQIQTRRDPFKVLISTMISLRTKDDVTRTASERLYDLADTPAAMLKLAEDDIAAAIYPAGFYKTKAKNILAVCARLVADFEGRVPTEIETLVGFPGVGRKTANLVRTLGFALPGICVDTHVHRITNRWGYVETKTPDETEQVLRDILPERYWIPINDWLVAYGQNLCVPISPWCSRCRLAPHCRRVGVERSR